MSATRTAKSPRPPPPKALLRSSPGSLYVQLATLLKQMIQNQRFPAGARLPSIQALSREYGVAPVTVCQALAMLENEGLLRRQQGKGTFVTERHADGRLWLRLESNWDSIIRIWEGSQPRILKVMDTIGSPPLEPGDGGAAPAYRYMRRVHVHESTPYAVIDIHLDRRLYLQDPTKFDSHMVIPLLETLPGVEITIARQTLNIGTADADTAGLLEIPLNSPVGIVRRVLQDQHGTAIYVGAAIYRGDMVRLERILKKQDKAP